VFDKHPLAAAPKPPEPVDKTPHFLDKFPVKGGNVSFTSGVVPVAYILEGATTITININSLWLDDDIQVFTRSGKHLVGTPILGSDPDYVWTARGVIDAATAENLVLTPANGFDADAAYDDTDLLEGGPGFDAAGGATATYGADITFTYSGDGDRYEYDDTGVF